MTLRDEILTLLKEFPRLTDREIADRLRGRGSRPQPINIACRSLHDSGHINRLRKDGRIRNYLANEVLPKAPPSVPVVPAVAACNIDGLAALLEIGFRRMGFWGLTDGKLKLEWDVDVSRGVENTLYAFVVDRHVQYVGKTTQGPAKRLYFYHKPGSSQSTNIRLNSCIVRALECQNAVEVYGMSDKQVLRVGSFALNLAAALEDDIIKTLKPEWNRPKKTRPIN